MTDKVVENILVSLCFYSPGTPAIPASTYEFAALCLRNALMLLPEENTKTDTSNNDDQDGM